MKYYNSKLYKMVCKQRFAYVSFNISIYSQTAIMVIIDRNQNHDKHLIKIF